MSSEGSKGLEQLLLQRVQMCTETPPALDEFIDGFITGLWNHRVVWVVRGLQGYLVQPF